jgi:hypothetical protein
MANQINRELYTNSHMETFGEVAHEVWFSGEWLRLGLDPKTKTTVPLTANVRTGVSKVFGTQIRRMLRTHCA